MITVGEAVQLILSEIRPMPAEEVPIVRAYGRILHENVRASRNVPPFDNSAMDGFAVRWEDVASGSEKAAVTLRILETVPAGFVAKRRLTRGTATRIMTGAPIPRGADTVVRVEHTSASGEKVRINRTDGAGSHIRRAGEDIAKGQTILEQGKRIIPADTGLMASVGKSRVRVYRRPTVALISTGDELLEVAEPPRPGKIVNSNSYTLAASIEETGAVPRVLGIVRDRRKSLAAALKKALRYDVVITSGGVSVGDYDFVKEALGDIGVRMQFWKVAQRPGHPMAFGRIGHKPVLGLPGNPVSSAVSFLLYARPALLKMMGHRKLFLPVAKAILEHDVQKTGGLKEFIRCRIRRQNGKMYVSGTGTQSSGVLRSLSLAQGLVVADEQQRFLEKGSEVPVILLDYLNPLQAELGF
ncbi:MAG: molybdopterin molybdotransferase MoeA [Candidatus Binatia bacterium]